MFDTDCDGQITCGELARALRTDSEGMNEGKIAKIIKEFDKNGDGCIDFKEFVAMMEDEKLTA